MSRTRRGEELAPSLFPFLAVLLCTMGALVLLLVLIVCNAQASAKEVVAEKKLRIEEAESQIEVAQVAMEKQLEKRRLDLERKRLTLQHLESHIQELMKELDEQARKAELLAQQTTQDDQSVEVRQEKLSQLEKQLAGAAEKLKQKLDKPDGDKPIFAIIPYQGPNGTHRRPIYLECTENGVVIQPEGVVISVADLRPPYGPNNPLDAALRTVRTEYSPSNGALTSTAYPLLVVRPSGVRTYALARQAMSGWDDQFGYELIEESLELTYPEGEPGLKNKIEDALVLARERQAALVMAMPGKYRSFIERTGGLGGEGFMGDEADSGGFGDDWQNADATHVGAMTDSSGGSSTSQSGLPSNSVGRAGLAAAGTTASGSAQLASAQGNGFLPANLDATSGSGQSSSSRGSDGLQFFGQPGTSGETFGSAMDADAASVANRTDATGQSGAASDTVSNRDGTSEFDPNASSRNGTAGQTGGSTGGKYSQQSGVQTGQSTTPNNSAQSSFGSSAAAMNSVSSSSQSSQPSYSQSTSSNSSMISNSASSNSASSSSADPNSANSSSAGATPSLTFTQDNRQKTEPVARRKGRNWAWNEGPPNRTPVVRSIRVVCYPDRWVVMPDGMSKNQISIPITNQPQVAAETLARAVSDRVESWGFALSGGYWRPEIHADVAPNAQNRFEQMVRLFEGSGLTVTRRVAVK